MEKNIKEEQILDSARKLFTKYGYKRVSMDEIAKDANVVKSTIYKHFKDKDDLLEYFIKESILELKDRFEEIEKQSDNLAETLHKAIYTLLIYRKNQQFIATLTKEVKDFNNPKLIEKLESIDNSIIEYIEQKLNEGVKNNTVRNCNTKVISYILFKAYIALAIDWDKKYKDNPLDEKQIADNISLFLKSGILK